MCDDELPASQRQAKRSQIQGENLYAKIAVKNENKRQRERTVS